jgi:hypothetical protein
VNWKPAIALFGASTGLVIDGWKVEQLGYVGANAKPPSAANLSSLTLCSTLHNPVRDEQDMACCHAQLYRCTYVLPSYTLTEVHAVVWFK